MLLFYSGQRDRRRRQAVYFGLIFVLFASYFTAMRASLLTPRLTNAPEPTAGPLEHDLETPAEASRSAVLDLEKITREAGRGAATLGASMGAGAAVYVRAARGLARGHLPRAWLPGVANLPAVGVGASAVVDAWTARQFGAPTDPLGRSSDALKWVSPVLNGLAIAAYRYVPAPKPIPGTVPDMLAQVAVAAAGGAASYSTREWMAQRALAQRPPREPSPPTEVQSHDRALARFLTQTPASVLRAHALARPEQAGALFLPILVTACVPYGWREELAAQVARLRTRATLRRPE